LLNGTPVTLGSSACRRSLLAGQRDALRDRHDCEDEQDDPDHSTARDDQQTEHRKPGERGR